MKKKLLLLTFLFIISSGYTQELPPVIKFSATDYRAGNQNWMVSQDDRHFIYVANNEGLLEYNGSEWTLYPSQNETIIRSVKVIGKRVYTGSYMEFGYWSRIDNGTLKYTSLSKNIQRKVLDDEQFWNILDYDQWIIFQSLNRIYIYDTKTNDFKIVSPKSGILKAFKTNRAIFYQSPNEGVFEIENGRSRLIIGNDILGGIRIVNIFEQDGNLMLQTQNNGFYDFAGGKLVKHPTDADALLAQTTIYSSLLLSDGSLALGSISNGIFILSADGNLKYHITQSQGLGNNTILSLFEDKDQNLWMGLDNGINCINIASPIKSFTDNTGILGTVYASTVHQGNLYVGTNQGLFVKKANSSDPLRFIANTKGQVWSLFKHDNMLFCGHDSGTFIISGIQASAIYNGSGTWKFEVDTRHPNRLLQGNYSGLSILEKTPSGWTYKEAIQGFNYSSKYFEILGNNIYVSHEYKGVYKLSMNNDFTSVTGFSKYTKPAKGKNASLVKHNGRILYASKDGVFVLNASKNVFLKDTYLSSVFSGNSYTSGRMLTDEHENLWIFTKNSINYFSLGKLSSSLKLNTIPIPSSLTNSMLGYENIALVGNDTYLVGTTDGYCLLAVNNLPSNSYRIYITAAVQNHFNEQPEHLPIIATPEIAYSQNNINFSFAVPEYDKYAS
ncbi:MAG TPA: two-component regulator propeller domain-containing protein, partial [Flavobacterium sp.]|nr:two-component regulator propeller domain-containing protein [Flavobacterium sp.]